MTELVVERASAPAGVAEALAIRLAVFVAEQGVTEAAEIDGLDDGALHLLARLDGHPAGTLRLRLLDGGRLAKLERVAVLAEARRQGVGAALIRAALDLAVERGATQARLHAQTQAVAFYAAFGFTAEGSLFDEDGLPHRAMTRGLARPRCRCPECPAGRGIHACSATSGTAVAQG